MDNSKRTPTVEENWSSSFISLGQKQSIPITTGQDKTYDLGVKRTSKM